MDVKEIYLENTNLGHKKFYKMFNREDGILACTWGKIGTIGQTINYDIKLYQSLLQEKLKKGYEIIRETKIKTVPLSEERDKTDEIIKKLLYLQNLTLGGNLGHVTFIKNCIKKRINNELSKKDLEECNKIYKLYS
jgi:predicted DNA-binding WGR domain protein